MAMSVPGASAAGADLGLGGALADQVAGETEEQRRRRMAQQQAAAQLGPQSASMSLGLGGYGGKGGGLSY